MERIVSGFFGLIFGFMLVGLDPARVLASQDRLPIVFAHGLGVPAELYQGFIPLKKVFREFGYELQVAQTPFAGTLKDRADKLASEIDRLVPYGRIHLIGHSMGGLDARLVAQFPEIAERIASVTTLSTPHRGSKLADYVWSRFSDLTPDERAMYQGLFFGSIEAIRDLTTENMRKFNESVRNNPVIRYYSMGFWMPPPARNVTPFPPLWLAHLIMLNEGASDNDAFVSVESAQWGEYLGTYQGDHWSETAPVPFDGALIYKNIFRAAVENLEREF